MKRAVVTGLVVAGILAPAGSSGGPTGELAPAFPTCVIRVWEDGSAAFRDAEDVRADAACYRAVSDYLERGSR